MLKNVKKWADRRKSWESSLVYYELINRKVREVQGDFHSTHCIMESVDFAEIVEMQHKNGWETLNKIMVRAAQKLGKLKLVLRPETAQEVLVSREKVQVFKEWVEGS